ncbi:homoserine dehydrogenase [Catalinimonas alkaloidigena]|uniref:Homoserine dehydrogenase n=1 Tax=Catalinimonas alkaloidigena TaxID=1075417 RepID=A0A1G9DQM8_9BACT|nr:homoserine dehydrogenase [Catalinimonas alkaloidigena]SDK66176.1 homoserine dehydrogenase [Catalinimonas alkaloidigena]
MKKEIRIGLFGFGCVGQGLYDVLNESRGIRAEIRKIAVKHADKPRKLPAHFFTTDADEILDDPEINLIVELINDPDAAFDIVSRALRSGKDVVSANKKMIAEHLPELYELQKQYGTSLLYEASSCGSIPIIRTLEEYYDNELLFGVSGIFNGSSNYILTKVYQEGSTYEAALRQAQELGFAETDPTLDVGGFDPLYKLCIITAHSYGTFIKPEEVFNFGIQSLAAQDIRYAKEKGCKIKLVCTVRKLNGSCFTLFVMPQLVRSDDPLFLVDRENNGVVVEAAFSDKQFFQGKGAGGHPTGSAVLSDISASTYEYRYEYKKIAQNEGLEYTRDVNLEVYVSYEREEDLEGLEFVEVLERYQGRQSHYVIGTVTLASLYRHKEDLRTRNIFIALNQPKVTLAETQPAEANAVAVS